MFLPGLDAPLIGPNGQISVNFAGSQAFGNTNAVTSSSLTYGLAPSATRKAIVMTVPSGDTPITTCSVGGVSATMLYAPSSNLVPAYWIADIPTGTTGTVQMNSVLTGKLFALFVIDGYGGVLDFGEIGGPAVVTNPSLTADIVAGGLLLAGGRNTTSGAFNSGVWTGVTHNAQVGPPSGLNTTMGAASLSPTVEEAAHSVLLTMASARLSVLSLYPAVV